jgi:hypothetical protein
VAAAGAPVAAVSAVSVSGVLSTVVVVDLLVVVRVDELEVVSVLVGSSVAGSPPHPATRTSVDNTAPTAFNLEACERCRWVGALNCGPFVSARLGGASH